MEGKERIEREKRLYEAALRGSVDSFNQLMKEDELTLARISTNCFDDTPLHVAAMLGHLDFAKALLNHKPDLAAELNSQGSSPLHLASVNGYLELVKLLISANPAVCLIRDEDGRTPLHLAVMKGRVDVIKELIKARTEVVRYRNDKGETLLHIAVKHNRLGSLKMLMELPEEEIEDFDLVNVKDDSGNTILHTAASLKQTKATKYLISEAKVKVNEVNTNGFTALDIIENLSRDIKSLEIREYLVNVGALRTSKIPKIAPNNHPAPELSLDASTNDEVVQPTSNNSKKNKKGKQQDDWVEKKRNALMVVASVIAAMAYQAVLSPPGGIWDRNSDDKDPVPFSAGTAVMAATNPPLHSYFWMFNTISLVSSLSTIFLLVSGLPLRRRIFMYLLTAIMWVTITAVTFSYLASTMAISGTIHSSETTTTAGYVWLGLFLLVFLAQIVRLIIKIVRKIYKILKMRFLSRRRNEGKRTNQTLV